MSSQWPAVLLPTIAPLGTEVEAIADVLEHTSLETPTEFLQEKLIHVTCTEVVAAGVPGPLWLWVELSPFLTTTSAAFWAAIGGGGGAIAPFAPVILAGTGVNGTVHTVLLPWTMHSIFARLVAQTPVLVATAAWAIQARITAKG